MATCEACGAEVARESGYIIRGIGGDESADVRGALVCGDGLGCRIAGITWATLYARIRERRRASAAAPGPVFRERQDMLVPCLRHVRFDGGCAGCCERTRAARLAPAPAEADNKTPGGSAPTETPPKKYTPRCYLSGQALYADDGEVFINRHMALEQVEAQLALLARFTRDWAIYRLLVDNDGWSFGDARAEAERWDK